MVSSASDFPKIVDIFSSSILVTCQPTYRLFIVDGLITMPIAVAGFLVLPDLPETTRAWFLTPDERKLCVDRMLLEGRAQRKPYSKEKIKGILTSWHWWILVPMVNQAHYS